MDAFVEVSTGSGRELRPLGDRRLTIGRAPTNDLALVDDPEVSRLHAVLDHLGSGWVVRDLGSRNGTCVNGRRIVGDRPLVSDDEISIGSARIVYRSVGADQLEPTVGAEPPPPLTPREREVLLALFTPATNLATFTEPASTREIAGRLSVSEAAVKQHLAHLYDKFAIAPELDRRRARLANEALRRGAISLAELRTTER